MLEHVLRMPEDSPWPLLLGASLAVCFTGLIASSNLVAWLGVIFAILALAGWHFPLAVSQPVAQPDPRPSGWWGMVLLIATEATLFAVLIATYYYLQFEAPRTWPPPGIGDPSILKPFLATALIAVTSIPIAIAVRAARRSQLRTTSVGLVVAALLGVAFLVFQHVLVEIVTAIIRAARQRLWIDLLHADRSPRDPRCGRSFVGCVGGVAHNTVRPSRCTDRARHRFVLAFRERRRGDPLPGPLHLASRMTARLAPARTGRAAPLAWFGVLAPPLAWATQLVVGYTFQEAGCGRPDSSLWGAGLNGLTAAVVIVCGAFAVAGGIAAFAALRASDGGPPDVIGFLAVSGIAAGFIFLLAIVLTGVALIPLDACRPG